MMPINEDSCACSLGDKVYVVNPGIDIQVLHNPDAPVSSQEMHWQDIKVPKNVPISRFSHAFALLNQTEIVIAGGFNIDDKDVGDIATFDTTTCEFKREVFNTVPFMCYQNQYASVCENTIIALVKKGGFFHIFKYTKGDTSATFLDTV